MFEGNLENYYGIQSVLKYDNKVIKLLLILVRVLL